MITISSYDIKDLKIDLTKCVNKVRPCNQDVMVIFDFWNILLPAWIQPEKIMEWVNLTLFSYSWLESDLTYFKDPEEAYNWLYLSLLNRMGILDLYHTTAMMHRRGII